MWSLIRRSTPVTTGPRRTVRGFAAASVTLSLVALSLGSSALAVAQPLSAGNGAKVVASGDGSGGLSAPFGSFAPVAGRPADPPIGVRFESLNRAGGTPIKIDGQDVRDTTDGQNYSIAVIDRHTRAVVESGTVNRGATTQLGAIATKYSGRNDYLMVISSVRGVIGDAGNTNAFADAFRKVGGRDLTTDELDLLKSGAAFSVIGVPGGAAGGAYLSIDHGKGTGPQGNVNGYLRVNVATDLYDVVNTESPTFDTTNASTSSGTTTITFNHYTHTSRALPAGQSGFLVVAYDDGLANVRTATVETNGTRNDAVYQQIFATELSLAAGDDGHGSANTVLVRSIGHPTPVGEAWNSAAQTIEKLGGNRLAFQNLGADSDYSLVGSTVAGVPAIEASTALGNAGPISGSLARNRSMIYTPVSGGSNGGVNTELIDIATQGSQAFPAFTDGASGTTAAGTAAADAYIGRALNLCAGAAEQPTCSVRTEFYRNFGANFQQAATDLESHRLDYPGDRRGFTLADYSAVRTRLGGELSMVNQVRTYFAGLQKPFGEAAQAGTIDIDKLTTAVVNSIGARTDLAAASFALGLLSKIASLGSFIPAIKSVTSGLSAAFGLGAFLSQPSGPPQLATDVKTKAGELGATVRAQMLATSRSLNGTAMLVVSDYGKLTAVTDKLPTEKWRLPNDTGPALATMSLAVQQSAAEKLVPLVFPWLIRGTPGRSAQSMTCRTEPIKGASRLDPVWEDQSANTSTIVPRDYLTSDGRSIPAPYWFAKAGVGAKVTPPASLGTMLFDPANSERGTLGLNLYSFLSPRVFGTIHQANDTAKRCDLFRTGPTRSGTPVDAAVGVPTVLASNVNVPGGATGTVTFTENDSVVPGCANRPVLGGTARCATTFTSAGEHHITAAYNGSDTEVTTDDVVVQVAATPTLLQRVYGLLVTFAAWFHLFGL